MTSRTLIRTIVVVAGIVLLPLPADAEMQWTFAPYLWGSNITVRGDLNDFDVVDRTADVRTVLDHTDFTGMAYFEGRGTHYGFFADVTYLNTGSQTTTIQAMPTAAVVNVTGVAGDMKATLVDAVGFLRPGGPASGLDVFIGARFLDVDQKLDFMFTDPAVSTTRVQVDKTLANAIAGVRYSRMLGETWDVSTRLDAGAGDAKFTWNAQATAGYVFGVRRNMSVRAGWKYMEFKYEDDENGVDIDSKLEFSGPIIGFSVGW